MKIDDPIERVTLLDLQPGDRLAVHFPVEKFADKEYVKRACDSLRQFLPEYVVIIGFPADVTLSVVRAEPEAK